MKKFISILLALTLMLSNVFILAYSSESEEMPLEFSCGIDAIAYLNKANKTLTIKGKGSICFFYNSQPPWVHYADYISYVVVEDGITKIPSMAFMNCYIEKITIPASVEYIESYALSIGDVKEIDIAENSKLYYLKADKYFTDTTWYKSQPDGPLYLGNMLLGYKGAMPENTTLTVKDGTYSINTHALYNQTNLVDIKIPDTAKRIGYKALHSTAWMNNQEYRKVIYLGNVLYYYNHPWDAVDNSDIINNLVIPEGIVSISDLAFEQNVFRNISIPSTLEIIGKNVFDNDSVLLNFIVPSNSRLELIDEIAFYNCNSLNEFELPNSLKRIEGNAFFSCENVNNVFIPASVEYLGLMAFDAGSLQKFRVSDHNPNYSSDENGILYNKNKTEILGSPQKLTVDKLTVCDTVTKIGYQAFAAANVKEIILPSSLKEICFEAFSESAIEKAIIPYGVERIGDHAFYNCNSLKEVELSKSIKYIEDSAFASSKNLIKIIVPAEVVFISGNAFDNCFSVEFFCYKNTAGYYFASENDISYTLLKEPDTSELDSLLSAYHYLDRQKYFPDTLSNLDDAVSQVDMTITVISQETVDKWATDINDALNALKYLPADYFAVNSAIKRAEKVNRSLYTASSLEIMDNAVKDVDRTVDISNQEIVNGYAKAINNAIDSLEYLPADYSKVYAAVEKVNKLEKILYSSASLEIVNQKTASVDYSLNITQQQKVDDYAKAILTAVSSLEYSDVTLRNNAHGVIVSTKADIVHPSTTLTVDKLDASGIETGNFAIGSYIKSVQYYDINLIRNGQKIQPNGTVTVKISIPDGVKPEKCRVYHVTEDPVDPLVRFSSTLDGNYIVFNTDHFSEFAVIEIDTYINEIEVSTLPSKLTYTAGEKLDLSGIEISAQMSDGTTVIIDDYDVSNIDTNTPGTKTVNIYYTLDGVTKTVSFEIKILPAKAIDIAIKKPSVEKIKYGDILVMHAVTSDLPDGYSVVWSSSSDAVELTPSENGMTCEVKSVKNGNFTVKATVIDDEGNNAYNSEGEPSAASQSLTSKGGFFWKIISFFKNLFKIERVIDKNL